MTDFHCTRNGIQKEGESCVKNNLCSFPYCGDEYEEPGWVCLQCAKDRDARMPEGHFATFHVDTCGICNMEVAVTEPRDFGATRYRLRVLKSYF